MMPGEYRGATGIVGSLGLVLIGANGVLLLAGTSAMKGACSKFEFTLLGNRFACPWAVMTGSRLLKDIVCMCREC